MNINKYYADVFKNRYFSFKPDISFEERNYSCLFTDTKANAKADAKAKANVKTNIHIYANTNDIVYNDNDNDDDDDCKMDVEYIEKYIYDNLDDDQNLYNEMLEVLIRDSDENRLTYINSTNHEFLDIHPFIPNDKKEYKKLCILFHPDKNGSSLISKIKFNLLVSLYTQSLTHVDNHN